MIIFPLWNTDVLNFRLQKNTNDFKRSDVEKFKKNKGIIFNRFGYVC